MTNWRVVLCFSLCATTLFPAPMIMPPAGGIIEREIEKEYQAQPLEPTRELPSVQIDIPDTRYELPEGKKVWIEQVEIVGNTVISTEEISRLIDDMIHKEISMREIYEICTQIERLYVKRGLFLARAYPPVQEINKGILKIEILEGKLGTIQIEGNHYYSEAFIRSYFNTLLQKPLQYDRFFHALMLLNDNDDLNVAAIFKKGSEVGCADVVLNVVDHRPLHLLINANDYGRYLTTNMRAGGRLDYGNCICYGDKLSITGVVGFPFDALYYSNFNYRIPLNRRGTLFDASFLASKFHVCEFTSLHLKGDSEITTLKLTQALMRGSILTLDGYLSADYMQIKNYSAGELASFDKLRVAGLGFYVDRFSPKQGRDVLTVGVRVGVPNVLHGLSAVDPSCSRVGAGGRYVKCNLDYDHIQKLPKNMVFSFHGTGQWSPYKLTLPEVLYIGGVDTVRGYPLAVALGDSGYYCNIELRTPPPMPSQQKFFLVKKTWREIVQLVLFVDHGGTFLRSGPNTFLWGSGLGLRITDFYRMTFSFDWGFPLNHRDLSHTGFVYIKLTGQPF